MAGKLKIQQDFMPKNDGFFIKLVSLIYVPIT